ERPKNQLARTGGIEGFQLRKRIDVDDVGGGLHVELHEIVKRGAAGQETRASAPGGNGADGVGGSRGLLIGERLHRSRSPHFRGGVLDGGNDADISTAATEITAHVFANLLWRG